MSEKRDYPKEIVPGKPDKAILRGPAKPSKKTPKKSDVLLYGTDRYKLVTPGIKEVSQVLKPEGTHKI